MSIACGHGWRFCLAPPLLRQVLGRGIYLEWGGAETSFPFLMPGVGEPSLEGAARRIQRSVDAVGGPVARFNRERLAAFEPRHGGGPEAGLGVGCLAEAIEECGRSLPRQT